MNDSRQRAHDDFGISNLSDSVQEMNAMPIPLPMEIPPPPNLSQLPAHILHSGTVETLLGQNEDLMARLKVNIRRNSILEQQIMEQDRQSSELKRVYTNLLEQFQVLQEKEDMLRQRSSTFDIQNEELKSQITLLQVHVEAAVERRDELHAGLRFERNYRRRIRAWVRPFIEGLKAKLNDAQTKTAFLDGQLGIREAAIGDLRERLAKVTAELQTHQLSNNQNQAKLIEGYETRLAKAETEAVRALGEGSMLKKKADRLDDAIAARVSAENRNISLERANKEIEAQVIGFRQEAKAVAAESASAQTERDQAVKASADAKAELVRAQDQFESLQAVWAEAQKKLEVSKLQQEALNKLNQELSRQLKTARKANEVAASRSTEAAPVATMAAESTAERLGKIDAILVELESGFSKSRDLEFIETPGSSPEASM